MDRLFRGESAQHGLDACCFQRPSRRQLPKECRNKHMLRCFASGKAFWRLELKLQAETGKRKAL